MPDEETASRQDASLWTGAAPHRPQPPVATKTARTRSCSQHTIPARPSVFQFGIARSYCASICAGISITHPGWSALRPTAPAGRRRHPLSPWICDAPKRRCTTGVGLCLLASDEGRRATPQEDRVASIGWTRRVVIAISLIVTMTGVAFSARFFATVRSRQVSRAGTPRFPPHSTRITPDKEQPDGYRRN